MSRVKLGICLNSLGVPFRRGLAEAQRLAVPGVQLAARGDFSPDQLTQTGRRELRNVLRAHNLELSAILCPLRQRLDTAENLEPRIEHVKKVMTLSFDLGPRRVIVEAGQIPEKEDDPRRAFLSESLQALANHGDRTGTILALETGRETGSALAKFLERFDTGSLGVNYDPANLLMAGFDPYQAARDLAGKIVHAHAKDARSSGASRAVQEVPLGHGDLDWMQLAAVFEEIDYNGWLVVERETGENQVADIANGIAFLRRFV